MGCVEHPLCHPFQQTPLSPVLAHTVLSISVCQRSPDVGEMLVKEEGPVPPCKDLPVPRGTVYTLCQQKDRLTRSLCVKQGHSGTEKPPAVTNCISYQHGMLCSTPPPTAEASAQTLCWSCDHLLPAAPSQARGLWDAEENRGGGVIRQSPPSHSFPRRPGER